MIEAGDGNVRATLSLGKDEGSLNDRLHIQRQALLAPIRIHAVRVRRFDDFQFEHCDMFADALVASVSNGWVCLIDFLDHRAGQAGEFRQFALQ